MAFFLKDLPMAYTIFYSERPSLAARKGNGSDGATLKDEEL
jgi:hypothetical protein